MGVLLVSWQNMTCWCVHAGLVKKDPTANNQAVPAKVGTGQGMASHQPYCFFNVTWQIVPAGSIAGIAPATAPGGAKKAAAPAPMLATSAKKAAAPAPMLATEAKKSAAPAPAVADGLQDGY